MTNNIKAEGLAAFISVIAYIRTPYGQKFAVPRQPGLVSSSESVIELAPPYDDPTAFQGLEEFSHIHVLFLFDKILSQGFRPKVRPPRLGGNKSLGVFATRSPFRPSRIGLSVMRLQRIDDSLGKVRLIVKGADLVDGTPIIDIKPYIPFSDCIKDASGGFAKELPPHFEVEFINGVKESLKALGECRFNTIVQTLSQDPRPAYKSDHDTKDYFARIYNLDIRFKVLEHRIIVDKVIKLGEPSC